MEWQKEAEKLKRQRDKNFWRPRIGRHNITFLSEGEEGSFEWDGEEIHKVFFQISIDGKEYQWSVTKGQTINSLYGQIVLVAANQGHLEGTNINLIVRGTGKETTYTVEEALPLMEKKEEKVGA